MEKQEKGAIFFSPVFLSLQCLLMRSAGLVKQKIASYYKLNDSLSFSCKAVCNTCVTSLTLTPENHSYLYQSTELSTSHHGKPL